MKAFDITPIIQNFYGDILNSDQRSNLEAYLLLIIPGILATTAIVRPIDQEFLTMMTTALAILFGFTFNSLLTTAKYSAKDDPIEEKVVHQTRLGTAYALLINLFSLITIITISIAVTEFNQLNTGGLAVASYATYFLLFHYLMILLYLMRYLYLLVIGGALEQQNGTEATTEDNQTNARSMRENSTK